MIILESIEHRIKQRMEMRKAEAHLLSVLELSTDDEEYIELKEKIGKFRTWAWYESPIS